MKCEEREKEEDGGSGKETIRQSSHPKKQNVTEKNNNEAQVTDRNRNERRTEAGGRAGGLASYE